MFPKTYCLVRLSFTLILILYCFLFQYTAQTLDSLKLLVGQNPSDSIKISLFYKITKELIRQGNLEEALLFAEKTKKKAELADHQQGKLISYRDLGIIHHYLGDYSKALYNFGLAQQLAENTGDKMEIASSNNNIGIVYASLGDYSKAAEFYYRSFIIMEKIGDKEGISSFYTNMGNIYFHQKNYPEALTNYFANLKLSEELKNQTQIAITYNNIGLAYEAMDNLQEALKYHTASLKIKKNIGDNYGIADSYNNIGNILSAWGNQTEALKNYTNSLKIREKIGEKASIAISCTNIGSCHAQLGHYEQALIWIEKGLTLAKEIGHKNYMQEAYKALAITHSLNKHWKEAYLYEKLFAAIKDTLQNEEISRKTNELVTRYKTEKQQQEIDLLTEKSKTQQLAIEKSNIVFYLWVSGLVTAILLFALFFYQFRIRTRQKAIILEQKLLLSQMNPHFIFNSLTAIQNLMVNNKQEQADLYLCKYSELMRLILENSRQNFIPLSKEIATLDDYLILQKLRFGDTFDYRFKIDPKIDQEAIEVPPMLAQPFIENAIEHGIRETNKRGRIELSIIIEGENIRYKIEDNGIGIKKSIKSDKNENHISLATLITSERLSVIHKKHSKASKSLVIKDISDNDLTRSGTFVTFLLPFRYRNEALRHC